MRGVLFALFGLLVVVAVPRLRASCRTTTPEDAFVHSDVVFTGVPASIRSLNQPRSGSFVPVPERRIRFRVSRWWKGPIMTLTVDITSGNEFQKGREYLVYATRVGDRLITSMGCGRGGPLEFALWDRYWLPDPVRTHHASRGFRLSRRDIVLAVGSERPGVRSAANDALSGILKSDADSGR
jgi:hypothetical protein